MSRNFELLQQNSPAIPRPGVLVPKPPLLAEVGVHYGQHPTNGPNPEGTENWERVLALIKKHARASLLFAAAVLLVVTVLTLLMKPEYEPVARLEIAPPGTEAFSLERRGAMANDTEYLQTQASNLASDELAIAVIRELRLDQNPDLTQQSLPSRLLSSALSAVQHLPHKLWGRAGPQQPATTGSDAIQLTPKESAALFAFRRRLTVQRDTSSRIISVKFASHNPWLAAEVTNTVLRLFIERTYEQRHKAVMQSTEWLSRQLGDVRNKMEESNHQLAEFQRNTGIAALDENRNTFSEHVAELSRQKTQAQTERIQLQAFLNKARQGDVDALPQVQSNAVIQQLTQVLAQTRAEHSKALAFYGKNHPEARKLQNHVDELGAQLALQRAAIVAQLETSYSAALSREFAIDREIRGTTAELSQLAQYAALKKEATATADLYNTLFSRIKEAGISAASQSSNLEIVDRARVLDKPTRPDPLRNFAIGILVALVGGVLIAAVRERLDAKIYRPEDMPQWAGLPTVSVIPVLEAERRRTARLFGHLNGVDGTAARVFLDRPHSVEAQAVRALRTTLMLSQARAPQVLMVLSSLPGEGKTTVAVNLSAALAQHGPTCLIDTDLQRAGIAEALKLAATSGLAQYLTDSLSLDSVLLPAPGVPQLTVLPAGPSQANAVEVLEAAKMAEIIRTLRQRFEFVIVDGPPILPFADGLTVAKLVDGIVLVGRAGVITPETLARSIDLLERVHAAPIVELVLNAAHLGHADSYYGYYRSRYQ